MGQQTLLDIVKANGVDQVVGLIDETITLHPELTLGAARTIPGINYRTLVRTSLPNAQGSYRNANEGVTPIKTTYENRLIECYMLEARIQCDKMVADAYVDGAEAFIGMEAQGVVEGEMQGQCRQFYYGPSSKDGSGNVIANAKGFPGLLDVYDATNMVIDAGGTTANTGSSVWLVKFGPQHVQWVYGINGQMELSPTRRETIIDPNDSTKRYDGYVKTLIGRPGLQVGSVRSVCRIKKLTADNGKGLTDTLINQALTLFRAGIVPDVIFMSRRSLRQLRDSRTTYNPLGAPAPFPTAFAGIAGQNIPIAVTDAISDTEPLTL